MKPTTTLDKIKKCLDLIAIWNQYCKLPDFKERCVTNKILNTPAKCKREFYYIKTQVIQYAILFFPEILTEWHVEDRGDQVFYIIALTIDGQKYRFHQKKDDTPWDILEREHMDVHVEDCPYYRDSYPSQGSFDMSDDQEMRNKFMTLGKLWYFNKDEDK